MIKELDRVPGYQRVLIVDEVDDPDNPGHKKVIHTETTAHKYVGVMSERMAGQQQQTEKQRNALAAHNMTLQQQLAAKEAELEELRKLLAAKSATNTGSSLPSKTETKPDDPDDPNDPDAEAKEKEQQKAADLSAAETASLTAAVNDLAKKGKGGK